MSTCCCGHGRDQHAAIFGLCTCMRYVPATRVGLRRRIAKLFRKDQP